MWLLSIIYLHFCYNKQAINGKWLECSTSLLCWNVCIVHFIWQINTHCSFSWSYYFIVCTYANLTNTKCQFCYMLILCISVCISLFSLIFISCISLHSQKHARLLSLFYIYHLATVDYFIIDKFYIDYLHYESELCYAVFSICVHLSPNMHPPTRKCRVIYK